MSIKFDASLVGLFERELTCNGRWRTIHSWFMHNEAGPTGWPLSVVCDFSRIYTNVHFRTIRIRSMTGSNLLRHTATRLVCWQHDRRSHKAAAEFCVHVFLSSCAAPPHVGPTFDEQRERTQCVFYSLSPSRTSGHSGGSDWCGCFCWSWRWCTAAKKMRKQAHNARRRHLWVQLLLEILCIWVKYGQLWIIQLLCCCRTVPGLRMSLIIFLIESSPKRVVKRKHSQHRQTFQHIMIHTYIFVFTLVRV